MRFYTLMSVPIIIALAAIAAPALADDPQPQDRDAHPAVARCEEALVNPVTGDAECVRPLGVPVDPPPQSAVPCSRHTASGEKRGCPKEPQSE